MGLYVGMSLNRAHVWDFRCIVTAAKNAEIYELFISHLQSLEYFTETKLSSFTASIEISYQNGRSKHQSIDVLSDHSFDVFIFSQMRTLSFAFRGRLNHWQSHQLKQSFGIFSFRRRDINSAFALPHCLLDIANISRRFAFRQGFLFELFAAVKLIELVLGGLAVEDPNSVDLCLFTQQDSV